MSGTDPDPGHHPWWSRVLYALYGAAVLAGAGYAAWLAQWEVATVMGGVGAVLLWKATQRRR